MTSAPAIPSTTPVNCSTLGTKPLKRTLSSRGIRDFNESIAWIGPPFPQFKALVRETVPPIDTKLQKIPSTISNLLY